MENKEQEIVNQIVDLWNDTQEYLPPVVMVDKYLRTIIINANKEMGIDTIKQLFEKVNKTPKLTGRNGKTREEKSTHTSIDFVLKIRNATKILNGDYDEILGNRKQESFLAYSRANEDDEGLF